ncbi:MAG: hypothetical protein Q8P18_25210 [Pseudomonadota bacterium]|nr:hypothetical protein [Pseudomonadota bacterium]
MMALVLALCGCQGGASVPLAPEAPVWVEARHVAKGEPVRLHAPTGSALPAVEGLVATEVAVEEGGTTLWELRGGPGSYVLDVPVGAGPVSRVFVDIGVDGPTGGPMEDLADVPPPVPPWWPRAAAITAAVATLVAVGLFAWRKLRPVPPPAPAEPADQVARRAWASLRARGDLEPDLLAAGLSSVFRRYLEAVHAWPATSRTSREILDALAGDLPVMQLERARRLLNAMDIVRFSERSAHEGFFAALDDDFEALLSVRAGASRA